MVMSLIPVGILGTAVGGGPSAVDGPSTADHIPPPSLVSNECLVQRTLPFGLYFFGTELVRYWVNQVPNGVSNEHSRSDRVFWGFYCLFVGPGGGGGS